MNSMASAPQPSLSPSFAAVILAGGSGTRFWPRSRRARAKQVLQLDGEGTMIQGTLARLGELARPEEVWVITNDLLAGIIAEQLPDVPEERLLREPEARNTAPACALVAFLLEKRAPATVLGMFPSDHTIGDEERFRVVLKAAIQLAASGDKMVVLGVPPTRPETGYGYIELGAASIPVRVDTGECIGVRRVRRFTEKPDRLRARAFVRSGNFVWNSGIFLWSAETLARAVREHKPEMASLLERIAENWGTPAFEATFAELYPQCEAISIDYAVLEPRSAKGEVDSHLYCLPADFAWNDLGSWAALYEHLAEDDQPGVNVIEAPHGVEITSSGCYVFSPNKAIALVGVKDLVVVETEDALLITTREGSQDVGKVVSELRKAGRNELI